MLLELWKVWCCDHLYVLSSNSQNPYFTFYLFIIFCSQPRLFSLLASAHSFHAISLCQPFWITSFHFQHHPGANPAPSSSSSSNHFWANPPIAPSWAQFSACPGILQLAAEEAENTPLSSAAVLRTGSCPFFMECFEILAWACKRSARCYYKEMQPHYLYTELCCLLIAPLS